MNPKLSILIPTTPDREPFMEKLHDQFIQQIGLGIISRELFISADRQVEVRVFEDNKILSIGHKRNKLLEDAKGEYIAFIDSDDRISDNYFKLLFEGISKCVDCCSLTGIITEDGNNPLVFQHSIKYQAYKTNPEGIPVRYERYPNHLNCIKASIAKQFRFPEINHGEDTDFATQMFKAGVLKTEHWIDDVIYYYDYRSKK